MKKQELRIGNIITLTEDGWVEFTNFFDEDEDLNWLMKENNKYVFVKSLSDEVELTRYGLDLNYYDYQEILPIPLTEQWLIDLGAEKWKDRFIIQAWGPGHPSQRFDIEWKSGAIILASRYQDHNDDLLMRHIQYVHQLQNLYHSLTGEELELKTKQ